MDTDGAMQLVSGRNGQWMLKSVVALERWEEGRFTGRERGNETETVREIIALCQSWAALPLSVLSAPTHTSHLEVLEDHHNGIPGYQLLQNPSHFSSLCISDYKCALTVTSQGFSHAEGLTVVRCELIIRVLVDDALC